MHLGVGRGETFVMLQCKNKRAEGKYSISEDVNQMRALLISGW